MKISLLGTVVFLGFSSIVFSKTIHVKADAGGANDGTSWSDAFVSLQDAFDDAVSGDQIWVAQGVYYPDEGVGRVNDDLASTFAIPSGVEVYGGFSGNEFLLVARDFRTNITVLSGDLDKNDPNKDGDGVLTNPEDSTGSAAYHVVTIEGTTETTELNGFVITGADYTNPSVSVPPDQRGGGVFVKDAADFELTNCVLQANRSRYGGGLYVENTNVLVTACAFIGNCANLRGGGYYAAENDEEVELINCAFTGGRAPLGGGSYHESGSRNIYSNCTLHGNLGTNSGSGVFDEGSNGSFANCILSNALTDDDPLDEFDDNGAGLPDFFSCYVQFYDLSGSDNNLDGTDPDLDPLFLAPLLANLSPQVGGDIALASNSPLIDKGDAASVQTVFDLRGGLREVDTVDLGAIEYVPTIHRVDHSATGNNNGTTWADAFTDLHDALSAAINGDQIWVAAGIYRPGDGSDRGATYLIDKTISVYGGFDGSELDFDDRDASVNQTILSGDLDQNDAVNADGIITDPANLVGDNALTVCTIDVPVNEGYNTGMVLVDGVTITGGLGATLGSGVNVSHPGGEVRIMTSVIRGNSAITSGGGVYFGSNTQFFGVSDCMIRDNASEGRGGGAVFAAPGELGGVSFINNTAVTDGGGAVADDATGELLFQSCDFQDNEAGDDGGAIFGNVGDAFTVSECTFTGNTADSKGGAIYNWALVEADDSSFGENESTGGGAIYSVNELILTECEFDGNRQLPGGNGGGAVRTNYGQITNSDFFNNSADQDGGALLILEDDSLVQNCRFAGNRTAGDGGALAVVSMDNLDVINCAFGGNKADFDGGGMLLENVTDARLLNCSFQGNSSLTGGGFASRTCTIDIINTVAWTNVANGAVADPTASYTEFSSTLTFTHCLLQNENPTGTGNLDGTLAGNDPDFVSPTSPFATPDDSGNLQLSAGSPAVNAGIDSVNTTLLDLRGRLRYASVIDLGAYEFNSALPVTFASLYPGLNPDDDTNKNGLTNFHDYSVGSDPRIIDDVLVQPVYDGEYVTFPVRANGGDFTVAWEKTEDLDATEWEPMVQGVDYAIESITRTGDQRQNKLELLISAPSTPQIFVRQTVEQLPES